MKFGFQPPDILSRLDFKDPALWVATWGGCGLMRPAPGTWGTLGGLPLGILLCFAGGPLALLAGFGVVMVLGFWAAGRFIAMSGEEDSPMIVIDEVAGLLVALIPAGLEPPLIAAAFVLFRAFDILKPWPVCWLDSKLGGPASVMLDDVMAGIYAALCLIGAHYVGLDL